MLERTLIVLTALALGAGCGEQNGVGGAGGMPGPGGSAGAVALAGSGGGLSQAGASGAAPVGTPSGGSGSGGEASGAAGGGGAWAGDGGSAQGSLRHPGLLTGRAQLEAIQQHLERGDEPWATELKSLQSLADAAELHPPPTDRKIFCGSYNRDENGEKILECDYAVEDGIAAYTLALLGYFTGSESRSERAIDFIMTWADRFQGFDAEPKPGVQGNNALLQAGWTAPWYANAAEILRYTYAGWTADHTERTAKLLKRLLPQVSDETVGPTNNWLHSRIEAHIAIAIFLDDPAMLDVALAQWKANTPSYFYIAADGSLPPKPNRPITDPSLESIWDTPEYLPGMTMETCRDLNHQQLGVRSILNSLAMASTQGMDALAGNDIRERLTTFLEQQAKWLAAKKDPVGACHEPIVFQPGEPPLYMDRARPVPYELGFSLLQSPQKRLSGTQTAILASPATRALRWVQKWETLTHHAAQ